MTRYASYSKSAGIIEIDAYTLKDAVLIASRHFGHTPWKTWKLYSVKGKRISAGKPLYHKRSIILRRGKPRENPKTHTLGRILEIRYERTTGRKPGLYKHVFKRGNGVLQVGERNGQKIIQVVPVRGNPGKKEYRFGFTEAMVGELVNYYHLAKTAGAKTKYERMIQASKWFNKEHPETSSTAAYKVLDDVTSQWFGNR